jgi:threonine aldolase
MRSLSLQGTFGNQLCLLTHTQRGQEVLMPETNHILWHEVGAAAVLAGVQIRPLASPYGQIDLKEVRKKRRGSDIHEPQTGLLCMENAHSSGCVVPLSHHQEVYELAQSFSIPVHLDGARLFNAAVALKIAPSQIAQFADSIQICLSKGLCAPIGSLVLGTSAFIHKARKK